MDEFKRFSIPVKWRKWVWVGVIGGLIFGMKWLAGWILRLEKQVEDCNQEKVILMEKHLRTMEDRSRADSVLMERFIRKALQQADEEIIQPKLDSLKESKS